MSATRLLMCLLFLLTLSCGKKGAAPVQDELAADASSKNANGMQVPAAVSKVEESDKDTSDASRSADVGYPYPNDVYWGDTHLHTNLSFDAVRDGTTLGPEDAFRFAKGEEVTTSTGQIARLSRPLDFLVIADHAEYLGSMAALVDGDRRLLESDRLRQWRDWILDREDSESRIGGSIVEGGWPEELESEVILRSAWNYIAETADQYNQPGIFTALIGFEWTAMPGSNHIHRVVVFKDDAAKATQVLPFSRFDGGNPQDLWKYLENYHLTTGGSVLAIPHNGNLSNGMMFPISTDAGRLLDKEYLQQRARWEPIVEVTQTKGDSETHPYLSPDDDFADFDTWDFGNFAAFPRKSPEMLEFEYARSALRNGLLLEREVGVNPYKFGMIGSTDSHTGISAVEEANFFGMRAGRLEPGRDRWKEVLRKTDDFELSGWMVSASGYAAVWAPDNTREEVWSALKRKEVYATTGPRMTVRFFGGWDFVKDDTKRADIAEVGYSKGVPMGGDLNSPPGGAAPSFLVAALRDPIGANLDRIQIVKGWIDSEGETHEQVYDVAWSNNGRKATDKEGSVPGIGSTVNIEQASWQNSIGNPELIGVWVDLDFDPAVSAFYYARVIEIPTPRWTAYDSNRFGSTLPPEVPVTLQERAYTSPIWYTP